MVGEVGEGIGGPTVLGWMGFLDCFGEEGDENKEFFVRKRATSINVGKSF